MQMEEDVNAMDMNMSVATERSVAKSKKGVYSNSSWDLIDAVDEGRKDIGEMKDGELPEEFKGKTKEEKQELLDAKRKEREKYQDKIAKLAIKREAFITEELQKRAEAGEETDDFGTSVNKGIMTKAVQMGYQ